MTAPSTQQDLDPISTAPSSSYLRRKATLVPILLLALWLLSDDETSTKSSSRHLAVLTALSRHPPCLRVYRALLEFNLMLWCLALSLVVWRSTIGPKMIGHLLFQPSDHDPSKDKLSYTESTLGRYHPITQEQQGPGQGGDKEEDDNIDDIDNNDDKENAHPLDVVYRIDSTEDDDYDDDNTDDDAAVQSTYPSRLAPEVATHDNDDDDQSHNHVHDDRHHQVTLIEPPSASSVAHAALDSLLLILVSLFLFTISSAEGGRYVDGMAHIQTFKFIALVTAPIFPLITFCGGVVATVVPWNGPKGRKAQWTILLRTPWAPLFHVTFRDGFIGDILTSSVRPLQDVAFTFFYIASGLQGWWSQSYDWDDAATADKMNQLPLESNWVLHTFVLPMCMASPLWWRFLQNLRQTYEYKTRWPYLGNALKYFIAAEVAVYGVYMQSQQQSIWWLSLFVCATLYQIWWDVFMDWNLLDVQWEYMSIEEIPRRFVKAVRAYALSADLDDESNFERTRRNIYQYHGRSSMYLPIPTAFKLRLTRIYSVKWMYWSIFFINIVLRFCWTLSFLPPHYLNRAGVLSETFEGNLADVLNPTIAVAEIIRRTLWGWLRVEWEAIKVGRQDPRLKGVWRDGSAAKIRTTSIEVDKITRISTSPMIDDLEMKIIAMEGTLSNDEDDFVGDFNNDAWRTQVSSSSSSPWTTTFMPNKRMYEMTEIQILGELCIYATIFTGLGLLAAAHRDTL